MDEPHSYDFVTYAYIQSGAGRSLQRKAMNNLSAVLTRMEAMPNMGNAHRKGMSALHCRAKLPTFYALEMRDWKTAAALEPAPGATADIATMTYWARTVGAGESFAMRPRASADLAKYDAFIKEVKKGKDAYLVEGTGMQIERDEMVAWVHYAKGMNDGALQHMREAADLQDKVGQAEVDIPAREMLADMLLELHRPQEALAEYEISPESEPEPLQRPLPCRACGRGSGRQGQGAAVLCRAAQIDRERRAVGTAGAGACEELCCFAAASCAK